MIFKWKIEILLVVLIALICDNNVIGQNVVPIRKCCKENEFFNSLSKSCEPQLIEDDNKIEPFYNQEPGSNVTFREIGFSCKVDEDLISLSSPDNNPDTSSFILFDHGEIQDNLLLEDITLADLSDNELYTDFCLDKEFRNGQFYGTVAIICKVNNEIFCQNNSCIHFCCGPFEYYNATLEQCQPYLNPDESETYWLPDNITRFITKAPECEFHIYDNRTQDIKILGDGSVEIDGIIWPYDQYCASFVEGQNGDEFEYWVQIDACFDGFNEIDEIDTIAILAVISIVFLGLLFVYIFVDQRQKLFGCMMLSAILMLFIFYLVFAIIKFSSFKKKDSGCIVEGYLIQFSYMSALFWLNAMSHMAWTTFRQLKAPVMNARPISLGILYPKYKWYALYSWGCPLIVTIVTIIMQNLDEKYVEEINRNTTYWSTTWTPKLGETTCFFPSNEAKLYYFHIINGPILVANLIFFVLFLWNMCFGVFGNGHNHQSITDQNKKRMTAIIKMFFIMGITWLAEIVSFSVDWHDPNNSDNPISFAFSIINALQGFFMFCAIYFDSSTITKIKSKLNCNGSFSNSQTNYENNTRSRRTSTLSSYVTSVKKSRKNSTNMELKEIAV